GYAAGTAMIAAAAVMSSTAAALAGAATVLGVLLLTKYKQKLQGAVVTVSAAALMISAIKSAQADLKAYSAFQNRESAIFQSAVDEMKKHWVKAVFGNMDFLRTVKTVGNLGWGDSKAMS